MEAIGDRLWYRPCPLICAVVGARYGSMFVRAKRRFKDGKEHRYWSVVENVRNRDGRVVQRQVLYLGEINDSQRSAWCRSIEVLQGDSGAAAMALFPADLPSPRVANRGAHLRGLHRLLPARHVEESGRPVRAGTHAASHPREVRHLADARRTPPDCRRTTLGLASPYATTTGSPTPVGSTQTAITGTALAQNPDLNRPPRHLPTGTL